ncbi:putative ankyrin repeat protein [Cotonvirus japonicus]|uniref:Ankyrin repeat protein n=1 Tax=Cotonvirus japonicus TaxID=2811091 RepID=A0ABM7NTB3_9VIRU|nr:putative ankyrin repeat protein [Cotonvirus japonicus]BCS83410.1 putative ankyrin repeat protein [Cotonvirus japonicus]
MPSYNKFYISPNDDDYNINCRTCYLHFTEDKLDYYTNNLSQEFIEKLSKVECHDIITYFIITNNLNCFKKIFPYTEITNENIWHLAISNDSYDIVEYLLNNGFDVNCDNYYAVNVIISNIHMSNSSLINPKSKMDLLNLIINYGGDLVNNNNKPFSLAVQNSSLDCMKILVKHGIDFYVNQEKNIMRAVYNDDSDILKFLIDLGLNVFFNNNEPLREAIAHAYFDNVKLLITFGADLNDITLDNIIDCITMEGINILKLLIDNDYDFKCLENNIYGQYNLNEVVDYLGKSGKSLKNLLVGLILYAQDHPRY